MVASTLKSRHESQPTPAIPKDLPRVDLTPNARQVLIRRYVRRGDDGNPAESIEAMFWRVAYHVAKAEEQWGGNTIARAREYYLLLTEKKFFPNSPTFTGAGTPLGQLAACFVLPISDDMGRDSAGIFQSLRDAALIQQTGGGNGFSFSRLRPKGGLVKTSSGQATGPVGFMRVYDHAFGEIAQGGTRRGANMGVLRIDHPDIEDFIVSKTSENAITNFNISVGITDAFMQAVISTFSPYMVSQQERPSGFSPRGRLKWPTQPSSDGSWVSSPHSPSHTPGRPGETVRRLPARRTWSSHPRTG